MRIARIYVGAALLAAALTITACGDGSPTAPAAPQATQPFESNAELLGLLTPTLNRVGLLTCSPLAPDRESTVIGPEGGTLRVGPHTLTVPRGALRYPVRITASIESERVNRVEFQPHGLEFRRPAALTMSYANCDLLGRLLPKRIAYVTPQLRILYLLESIDHVGAKKVTGRVDHFSEYAVAW